MRYLKLYLVSIKRSIISKLEYRKSSYINLFSFLFSNVCSILSIYFIVNSIPELKTSEGYIWSAWEIGFLYGFTMLPVALDHLITDELWLVAYRRVKDGSLDSLFLRPAPTLFLVISETFQTEAFGELIVGVVMLIICGLRPEVSILFSFGNIILFIVAIIFGAIIISSLKIIFASFAFKIKSSGPLLQIIYNFISYTKYPLGIYHPIIKGLLTFILPFAIFISFPVEIFLGFSSWNPYILSLIIIAAAILLLFLSINIWNFFERRYESTGS